MTEAEHSTRHWLSRLDEAWRELSPGRRAIAAWMLLSVSTLPVLARLSIGGTSGDIRIFFRVADALMRGLGLYREVVFEYPPYVLPFFVPPYLLSHDLASFRLAFGLEMWALDAAIKAALLVRGVRLRQGLRDLAPFLAYSLGSAALGHVLLQRYDLIPAALSLAALLAMASDRPMLAGALVVVGAGTKVYPVLLFPVFVAFAWQRHPRDVGRLIGGAALATVPSIAAAMWMPWWRFASFHTERGLQAESLPASLVWALHFAGVPAGWDLVGTSNEVTGPVAAALVGPSRLLWVATSLACVGLASLTAVRLGGNADIRRTGDALPHLAVLVLLPVLGFVATNTVFSPQFHLWLIPLAAAVFFARPALPGGNAPSALTLPRPALRAALCVSLATFIVPVFYPHREYALGLGPLRTGVLVLRNLVLLYALGALWMAVRTLGESSSVQLSRPAEREMV